MNTSLYQHKFELLQWLSKLKNEAILKQITEIKAQNQPATQNLWQGVEKCFLQYYWKF